MARKRADYGRSRRTAAPAALRAQLSDRSQAADRLVGPSLELADASARRSLLFVCHLDVFVWFASSQRFFFLCLCCMRRRFNGNLAVYHASLGRTCDDVTNNAYVVASQQVGHQRGCCCGRLINACLASISVLFVRMQLDANDPARGNPRALLLEIAGIVCCECLLCDIDCVQLIFVL